MSYRFLILGTGAEVAPPNARITGDGSYRVTSDGSYRVVNPSIIWALGLAGLLFFASPSEAQPYEIIDLTDAVTCDPTDWLEIQEDGGGAGSSKKCQVQDIDTTADDLSDNNATDLPYTPTTGADWADPDPTEVGGALDTLAGRDVTEDDLSDNTLSDLSDYPATTDTRYVEVTGDTMTGSLSIEAAEGITLQTDAASPGFSIYERPTVPGHQVNFVSNAPITSAGAVLRVYAVDSTAASKNISQIAMFTVNPEGANYVQAAVRAVAGSSGEEVHIRTQEFGSGGLVAGDIVLTPAQTEIVRISTSGTSISPDGTNAALTVTDTGTNHLALVECASTQTGDCVQVEDSAGTVKSGIDSTANLFSEVLRLQCVSAAPTGAAGDIYCDSDLNLPCFHNGTNWVQMDDFSTVCS